MKNTVTKTKSGINWNIIRFLFQNFMETAKMEERFVDLEIRISHQEDMIDELNKLVYQQQVKIDQLEAVLKDMAKRIIELENDRTINERPPHY